MNTPRLTLITASLALFGSILATPTHAAAMTTTDISPTLPTIAAQIAHQGAAIELAKRGRSGTGVEDKDRGGEDEPNDVCDPTDDNDDDCAMAAGDSSTTLAKRGRGRSGTGVEDGDRGGEDEPNDVCDPTDDNDDDCLTASAGASMTLAKRGRSGTGIEDGDRGGETETNDVCDPSDDNDDDCA